MTKIVKAFLSLVGVTHLVAGAAVSPTTTASAPTVSYTDVPLDPAVPEDALALFVIGGIRKFAPFLPGWREQFPIFVGESLQASFNTTRYDFNGFFNFLEIAGQSLNATYTNFGQNITGVVAAVNPTNPLEGVVNVQGRQGGFLQTTGQYGGYPNAAYAVVNVVDGAQKIVEFRDLNNRVRVA